MNFSRLTIGSLIHMDGPYTADKAYYRLRHDCETDNKESLSWTRIGFLVVAVATRLIP